MFKTGRTTKGIITGDNNKFFRAWWEVQYKKINFGAKDENDAFLSGFKWFPCNKGGERRKWYGNNEFIVNFPEQDSENGCKKNNDTHNLYKYYVRIFKRFRNELENIGLDTNVSSYVIECLLYNVPNNYFMAENYLTGLKNIIYYLLVRIDSSILVEVNQIKQMFRKDLFPEQKTTKENVKTYLWYINNLFLEVVAA